MVSLLSAIAHLIVIVAIAFQLYKCQPVMRQFFWPALSIKLISGICLGLLYTYYYPAGDTFAYFDDASKLAALARIDLSSYLGVLSSNDYTSSLELNLTEPRALFLVKITSIFSLVTVHSYWAIGFYFSFFSFLASWFLVCVIGRNIPSVATAAVIAFLFLPSVVFWSSGLLKESLAMASLFFLTGIFLKAWFHEKLLLWNWILAVLSLWLFWHLKYYYVGVFVAVISATLVCRFFIGKRFSFAPAIEGLVWSCVVALPLVLVSFFHPNFSFTRLFQVVLDNNLAYNGFSSPDNIVHFRDLKATPLSMLLNAPWALFSGLFRPLFWETSSFIQFLEGVENTFLLLLFAASAFQFKRYFTSPHRLLVLCLVAYVIILGVLLTLSAPNFGTLSRYRVGYISFFAFIILCENPVLQYVERSFPRLVRM